MKRSDINGRIQQAIGFMDQMGFKLPAFAFWDLDAWRQRDDSFREIRDCLLGWDITDFGVGDFDHIGLLLFTLRNGNVRLAGYSKPYAEKIMIVGENQVTPWHYHGNKMEDIINRGGGNLLIQVHARTDDDRLSDEPVRLSMDGRNVEADAGAIVTLQPGDSITLFPGQYHTFRGEPGVGKTLVGEVSMVNDDFDDNHFLEPAGRFPAIDEDVAPQYLLCTDYATLLHTP